MVRAIALDHNGKPFGEPREFSDEHWAALLKFGKTLRWKQIKEKRKKKKELIKEENGREERRDDSIPVE